MEPIFVDTVLGYSLTDEQREEAEHIVLKVKTICRAVKNLQLEGVPAKDERFSRYYKSIEGFQSDLSDLIGVNAAGMTIAEVWNKVME